MTAAAFRRDKNMAVHLFTWTNASARPQIVFRL